MAPNMYTRKAHEAMDINMSMWLKWFKRERLQKKILVKGSWRRFADYRGDDFTIMDELIGEYNILMKEIDNIELDIKHLYHLWDISCDNPDNYDF